MFVTPLKSPSMAIRCVAGLIIVNLLAISSKAETPVEATSHARLGEGPLHAYVATLSLPADGLWRIRAPESETTVRELYLMPTQPARLRQLGKRMYAALEDRQIQAGKWKGDLLGMPRIVRAFRGARRAQLIRVAQGQM